MCLGWWFHMVCSMQSIMITQINSNKPFLWSITLSVHLLSKDNKRPLNWTSCLISLSHLANLGQLVKRDSKPFKHSIYIDTIINTCNCSYNDFNPLFNYSNRSNNNISMQIGKMILLDGRTYVYLSLAGGASTSSEGLFLSFDLAYLTWIWPSRLI